MGKRERRREFFFLVVVVVCVFLERFCLLSCGFSEKQILFFLCVYVFVISERELVGFLCFQREPDFGLWFLLETFVYVCVCFL